MAPPSIDRTQLMQLASLARLSPQSATRLRPRLEQLLAIVARLPASESLGDATSPAGNQPPTSGRWREDAPAAPVPIDVVAINAAHMRESRFLVPRPDPA